MKTSKVNAIFFASVLALSLAPSSAAERQYLTEPSLEFGQASKKISKNNLEQVLNQHSLSQITHGLLLISVLGLLAIKRR